MKIRFLLGVAGVILLVSALGKWFLLSKNNVVSMGPFLGNDNIRLYWVLHFLAALEAITASYALFEPSRKVVDIICYWALLFTSYRITIYIFGFNAPCSCLGDIPQLIGLGQGADKIVSWTVYGVFILVACALYSTYYLASAAKESSLEPLTPTSKQ